MNSSKRGFLRFCAAIALLAFGAMFSSGAVAATQKTKFDPVATAEACPPDRSPIMILGTYHMANPELDFVKMEADDVLAPRRQNEIAGVVEQLARFRPTKVMVEAPYSSPAEQQQYTAYLSGKYELTRNEIDQIGFRLAKRMELAAITPVDFPMFMSGLTYDEVDFGRGQPAAPAQSAAPPTPQKPRQLSPEELRIRQHSIAENLAYANREDQWLPDYLGYMSFFEDDPSDVALYTKTDTLLNWYKRNFRIWANVVRETKRPHDRDLLLIGSGHLGILRELARDMPGFCLVEPAEYLEPRR